MIYTKCHVVSITRFLRYLLAPGDVSLQGRIVLNLWRLLKSEVKSTKYTVHGLASEILGITFPYYSRYTLSSWWFARSAVNDQGSNNYVDVSTVSQHPSDMKNQSMHRSPNPLRFRCLNYLLHYLQLTLKILDSVELLSRSEELARLFGTDIWSVMSRGSQHRVEAMTCRAAHALGYLLHTASKKQVNGILS